MLAHTHIESKQNAEWPQHHPKTTNENQWDQNNKSSYCIANIEETQREWQRAEHEVSTGFVGPDNLKNA